ncbi:hypothetical protein CIB50_0000867 [Kocuria varians]|uniref:Uncharacterized protein n=1 Tax=Kocuria varians TaxID=1272 RepID=A0A7D7KZA9_KOCVA|nr:hypothetical protein CIB50_0000867 [Kocuria varians]
MSLRVLGGCKGWKDPGYQETLRWGVRMGVMATHGDAPSNEAPSQEGVSGGSSAVFTMKEAADVAGVSVSTLRRRRAELEGAGATITSAGWQVPMTTLIAVGLIHGEGFHTAPPRPDHRRRLPNPRMKQRAPGVCSSASVSWKLRSRNGDGAPKLLKHEPKNAAELSMPSRSPTKPNA